MPSFFRLLLPREIFYLYFFAIISYRKFYVSKIAFYGMLPVDFLLPQMCLEFYLLNNNTNTWKD